MRSTSAWVTGGANVGPTSSTTAAGPTSKLTSSQGLAARTVALSSVLGPGTTWSMICGVAEAVTTLSRPATVTAETWTKKCLKVTFQPSAVVKPFSVTADEVVSSRDPCCCLLGVSSHAATRMLAQRTVRTRSFVAFMAFMATLEAGGDGCEERASVLDDLALPELTARDDRVLP